MYKPRNTYGGGQAFDAAGPSGLAFLNSQLEQIDVDLVKPLQDTTHQRDLTIEFGGGFPQFISAYAANYGTTGGGQYGLQGTNNTDIPLVQVDLQKGVWNTFIWASSMVITYLDLKRLETSQRSAQPAPFSLQELMEEGVQTIWAKALDYVAYLGWQGQPGLVNNTNVPELMASTDTNSHTTWVQKLSDSNAGPSQILQDINTALNQTVINSGYNVQQGMANTILLPYTQFQALTVPMTLGGVGGFQSILEYVKKNSVATQAGVPLEIHPLPNYWIAGKGASSTDRAVFYRNDKRNVYMKVPQPMQKAMTVPTTRDGGAYETIFNGCISQVIFKRTQTAVYLDGI